MKKNMSVQETLHPFDQILKAGGKFMERDSILEELAESVRDYDTIQAKYLSRKALELGIDPVEALEKGLARGLKAVGDRFGQDEAFLTELIAASQAMEFGAAVLNEEIARRGANRETVGRYLIGTVDGDIHSIGKNIVVTLLRAAGFEVLDLGIEVPTSVFVDKVRAFKPDILGLSALMTTTMTIQREVINALEKAGLRKKVKVVVGGSPVTEEWASEIGADAFCLDASNAVELALSLLE
jgi:corrinoid protein of di/trimethylamine methyltransferase